MNRKQKASLGLVGALLLILPTSAYATETESLENLGSVTETTETVEYSTAQWINSPYEFEVAPLPALETEELPEPEVEEPVEAPLEHVEVVGVVEPAEAVNVAPQPVQAPTTATGSALLNAALSQNGYVQDCTDLVQNSLAMLGLTTRRDQGGYDYGVRDFAQFGTVVPWTEAQPGDIAFVGPNNGGHVWIISDPHANYGVHGGWINGVTYIDTAIVPLSSHTVIRPF